MSIEKIRKSFKQGDIRWRKHALERLLERNITRKDVHNCVESGTVLKKYTDTAPFPAYVIEGRDSHNQLLHTVIGFDEQQKISYIITPKLSDLFP